MVEPEIGAPAKRVNGRMWQPGESGNRNGRPVGARGRFSQRFIADLTDAWEKHGAAALEQTAKLYPDRFVGICSHLIPKDVSVSLTAALPGDLEASDWTLILEVLGAVKRGLPDEVLGHPARLCLLCSPRSGRTTLR
jgi:hypothetical protein